MFFYKYWYDYWLFWAPVIGRYIFSAIVLKKLAKPRSSTVYGGQHDAWHVTFEFVADEI